MVDEAEAVPGYEAVGVRWLSVGVVDDGIEDESPQRRRQHDIRYPVARSPHVELVLSRVQVAEARMTHDIASSCCQATSDGHRFESVPEPCDSRLCATGSAGSRHDGIG